MKTPWANVVLLILVVVQAVTGYFGMVNGRFSRAWILWAHGIGAYALLVLLYWKGGIVLDAIRRKTVWTRRRLAFAGMFALLLIVICSGLLWTFSGPIYLGGFSLVSLHIYLAVPLLLLMAWHAWHMRFIWRVPGTVGRRLFMGTAVSTLLGLLFWRTADWGKDQLALPGAARRFTGSYENGSFSNRFPVVSWINDNPPPIDVANWQLVVEGAVKRPYTLTYAQLREMMDVSETAVVDCTGGWFAEQVWRGVSLATCWRWLSWTTQPPASPSFPSRATSGGLRWTRPTATFWRWTWSTRRSPTATASPSASSPKTSAASSGSNGSPTSASTTPASSGSSPSRLNKSPQRPLRTYSKV